MLFVSLYIPMKKCVYDNSRMNDAKLEIWRSIEYRLAVFLRSFSLLSAEDREDCLQSALIAWWQSGPTEEKEATPWLYRVVRNGAIDLLRKRARKGPSVSLPLELVAREPGPESTALSRADIDFVSRFIETLDDTDRELSFLAFAEHMSYPAMAEMTGLALGTIKWRMAAVKKLMKDAYRREME